MATSDLVSFMNWRPLLTWCAAEVWLTIDSKVFFFPNFPLLPLISSSYLQVNWIRWKNEMKIWWPGRDHIIFKVFDISHTILSKGSCQCSIYQPKSNHERWSTITINQPEHSNFNDHLLPLFLIWPWWISIIQFPIISKETSKYEI